MLAAANPRHGVVASPQHIQGSHADIGDVFHVGVPPTTDHRGRNPAGGAGRTLRAATLAALGESMERYAGACATPPLFAKHSLDIERIDAEHCALFTETQRAASDFPAAGLYSDECPYIHMYELPGQNPVAVPAPLVLLRDFEDVAVATSNGLAAGSSPVLALLRAVQEIVERDALMSTWLHSIPARQITLTNDYHSEFLAQGGSVSGFDLTPVFSNHPVAAVAATLPMRGKPRHAFGVACRASWHDAVEKAWLECVQGLLFAGWYTEQSSAVPVRGGQHVTTFDQHATYYTWNPDQWEQLPFFGGEQMDEIRPEGQSTATEQLTDLIGGLNAGGVRVLYRDLTTVDLRDIGIHVVRAFSPQLTPLHCHERFPFLGGNTSEVGLRYPWFDPTTGQFPNSMPHPLG